MERPNYFLFLVVFATAADMITSYLDIFVRGLYETNSILAWFMRISPWLLIVWLVFWVGLFYATNGWMKKHKMNIHWEVISLLTSLSFLEGAVGNLILYLGA